MPHDLPAALGGRPVRTRPFPAWPSPSVEARAAVNAVFDSGHWWQNGDGAGERLEAALVDRFEVRAAVAVTNGTLALEVALRAAGVGPGDEVIVPATTFVSSASAVSSVGATPVPADVRPDTFSLDLGSARESVTARTKALVVVHLGGQPADLTGARLLCDEKGLLLIEDSAQAVAAAWDGRPVGSAGDMTAMSFQAAKLWPAGEGGAVLIRSDGALAGRVERIANCGRPRGSSDYDHLEPGTNARISEFHAALVLSHMAGTDALWLRRKGTYERLDRALPAGALAAVDPRVTRHDHYMVLLRLPEAALTDGLDNATTVRALAAEGIPARVLFPAWHLLPAFRPPTGAPRSLPVAEGATRSALWLHHRLLLDPDCAEDLPAAWSRVTAHASRLAAGPEVRPTAVPVATREVICRWPP
ncbi:DegT/DnrJ/EryC1/StrS family aminotransferase [Streptomyces sp. NPDC001568]|uniref:DegT/DnrJ/EryC1/StrS family aminotransferase n=1 Tax=Streptomyces sp. NPDC001568 TaxID=3364588 RepID=UPI0036ACCB04